MFDDLLSALKRVDQILETAINKAEIVYGTDAATDAYRGLYINQKEVAQLLNQSPGLPLFASEVEPQMVSPNSRLAWLQQANELSAFDLDVMLIALAPEIDLKYERLYAYLQDDVTRKRPTVDLILNLLCPSPAAKLSLRNHFCADAPLIKQGLIHLFPDSRQLKPPLLSYYLKLDPQIVRFLLRQQVLDARLVSFCRFLDPTTAFENLLISKDIQQALPPLVNLARKAHQSLIFYFCGSQKNLKRQTAAAIAEKIGLPLLVADLLSASEEKRDWESILKILFREVQFQDALLYLEGIDTLHTQNIHNITEYLFDQIAAHSGIIILSGVQPWFPSEHKPLGVINISFPLPDFAQRRHCWSQNLAAVGIQITEHDLDDLAQSFRLTTDQITDAVATASNQALWDAATKSPQQFLSQMSIQLTPNYLFAAARIQSGHQLATLAKKIEPKYVWNDIVLLPDQLEQLEDICNQAKYQHQVYEQWGFASKLSLGKGLNVLFTGLPGTGKTMAAEAIANDLQLDLYKIDLSQIVSKYIGETEKNLEQLFTAAENTNAILLFDEADAIFGKRSEVKDAHDRYANLEVAYLLQKMEEYQGITILTTNLRQNLDDAFTRRIRFIVEFPFPEAASRLQIWQGIFPPQIPLAATVDLSLLASKFKLAGGNIRNIALAAAFLAAQQQDSVGMSHLFKATKREFQKMGRLIGDEEFGNQEK